MGMKTTKVKATFKGKTKPGGFVKNETYTLKVSHGSFSDVTEVQTLQDEHSARYESAFSFLEDWTDISDVK